MAISPGQIAGIFGAAAGKAISPPAVRIDNRSSSASNASVSVAPVISVVTGGGTAAGSPNASASGSPYADSSGASAPWPSAGGQYATQPYGRYGGTAVEESATGGGILDNINPLYLVGAAGVAYFLFMKPGGKKKAA